MAISSSSSSSGVTAVGKQLDGAAGNKVWGLPAGVLPGYTGGPALISQLFWLYYGLNQMMHSSNHSLD
jgi:hypothetical protein